MQLAESGKIVKKRLTKPAAWSTIMPIAAKALKGLPSAPFVLGRVFQSISESILRKE